jgi:5-(carboxyamino)imidazole ribonucleotide synthase
MSKRIDIAIVGGGQLGKMLIEEAMRYNLRFATLDPEQDSPASIVSHHHITGSLQDAEKISELGNLADTITYEIENINAEALFALEQQGKRVVPSSAVLHMVKDKGLQKTFYADNGIPTAPFVIVDTKEEWKEALTASGFTKIAAKLCTGGYDGKGVALLDVSDILEDKIEIPFDGACVLEQFIPCDKEISIIVARDVQGNTACFPPVEMEFDPVANLVTHLICPAKISSDVTLKANAIAERVVNKCNGVGLFAVEMFVLHNGEILVNEMAPRPHNSGHHTIQGCYTSQYEQLIRVLTNKPLGSTAIVQPSAMINLIGPTTFSGAYKLAHEAKLLQIPGVYIHLYNKATSKPHRKLGHITVLGETEQIRDARVVQVLGLMDIVAVH